MNVFVVVTEYHNADPAVAVFSTYELAQKHMKAEVDWFLYHSGWSLADVAGSFCGDWVTVGSEGDCVHCHEVPLDKLE
jgi:ABC-type taurine transport system substrate-binding protein